MRLRPVRPADRPRILEITREVWGGGDYLPQVLDSWIRDTGASFQAAEVDGVVAGIHRLRPISPEIVFYEGLRVAAEHRRQGIARSMLGQAVVEARGQGFQEIRLMTGNPNAARLFEATGFRLLVACLAWEAARLEGGDAPRLAGAAEAPALYELLRRDPGTAAYGGVNPDWQGVLDISVELLGRLGAAGRLRAGPGGRALAVLRPDPEHRLDVSFVAGSGAPLRDLLVALRVEADSRGLEVVRLLVPEAGHPASGELAAVGYDLVNVGFRHLSYGLRLRD